MDAVILAAGRGSRLAGYVPPFQKPLIVVDGAPLILRTIAALEPVVTGRIVIVVAPENALPIVGLLRHTTTFFSQVRMLVQPEPTGPGHALALAAPLCRDDRVMVVCGDNLVHTDDVARVGAAEGPVVVGVRRIKDYDEAARFTLLTPDGYAVEPEPAGSRLAVAVPWEDGYFRAWLGPICVDQAWLHGLNGATIGWQLNDATLVEVDCRDIGTPADLP